jgi:pyruvate formate lyase activating enzyme
MSLGLKYVYVGNVDDVRHQSTYCPSCQKLLIERNWYEIGEYNLEGPSGSCAGCGYAIAGVFGSAKGRWGRKRMPVSISNWR